MNHLQQNEFENLRRKALMINQELGELSFVARQPMSLFNAHINLVGYTPLEVLDMADKGFYIQDAEWFRIVMTVGEPVLKTYSSLRYYEDLLMVKDEIEFYYSKLTEDGY